MMIMIGMSTQFAIIMMVLPGAADDDHHHHGLAGAGETTG